MEQDNIKMSSKDKRDIVIEAGIQAIPYVGGSIATLYFGWKQEIRFKRLESFYAEFAAEIEKMKDKIKAVNNQNNDALIAIIENLNEKVEKEPLKEKRQFLKNYLRSTLIDPITNNFDERRFFLDVLGSMTLLECELLKFINSQQGFIIVGKIELAGIDQYAIVGAVGMLKNYGFLTTAQMMISFGGDNSLNEQIQVSKFGKKFIEFCLI